MFCAKLMTRNEAVYAPPEVYGTGVKLAILKTMTSVAAT